MADTTTRSGMLWEVERILNELKETNSLPQILLMENVPQVHGSDNVEHFNKWQLALENMGYKNYFQDIIATDYGIPQTRNRCFMVSILGDYSYSFPQKIPLKLKLKDLLEDEVDEKYYLTDSMIKTYQRDFGSKGKEIDLEHQIPTLTASMGTGGGNVPILKQVGKLDIKGHDCIKRVYSDEGLSPTLTDMQGGNRQPKVELKSKCKRLHQLVEKTEFEQGKVLNMDLYNQTTNESISQCLTEPHHNSQRLFDGLRIRKLTPKECWRLMGFDDEDFEKAAKVNSNTQLYKQAGNSICVPVLMAIFKELIK